MYRRKTTRTRVSFKGFVDTEDVVGVHRGLRCHIVFHVCHDVVSEFVWKVVLSEILIMWS